MAAGVTTGGRLGRFSTRNYAAALAELAEGARRGRERGGGSARRPSRRPANDPGDPDPPRRDGLRRAESRPGGPRYPAQRRGPGRGRRLAADARRAASATPRSPPSTAVPARASSAPPRSSARPSACGPSGSTSSATSTRGSGRACRSTRSSGATSRSSASGSRTRCTICPPQGETVERAMERIKSAFRPLIRRHQDEAIGLVVGEPLAQLVACYLRREPRVQLDDHVPTGGFETDRRRPRLGRNGDGACDPRDDRSPDRASPMPTAIPRRTGRAGMPHRRRGDPRHGQQEGRRTPGMDTSSRSGCPKGSGCGATAARRTLFRKQVEQNLNVCPECNHHFSVSAVDRIAQLLDADTFEEWYRRPPPRRPARLQRPPALSRAGQGRAGTDRPERGGRRRPGVHQGDPHRLRR